MSMSATSTPLPVYPAAHDSRAWMIVVISSREPVSTEAPGSRPEATELADVVAAVAPEAAAATAGDAGIRARMPAVAAVADRRPRLPRTSALRRRGLTLIAAFNHGKWYIAYE